MKKLFYPILALLLILLVTDCRKENNLNKDGQSVIAGSIRLNIQVMHHSWGVPYIPVYLKRNATEFPGYDTSLYDTCLQADNEGKLSFVKLYPGNYFLYAHGYDYYFGSVVRGYMPIRLNSETLVNNTGETTLYVSE